MAQVLARCGIFSHFINHILPRSHDLRPQFLAKRSKDFRSVAKLSSKQTVANQAETKPMSTVRRFLIVSLGNPEKLRETFHSAGHLALESLQRQFPSELSAFSSERYGKKAVLASTGPKYTLLQSPTLMNVSGPWLAKAYKEYLASNNLEPEEVALVIVHDDLEEDLGVVKIRQWNKSHRGHNGVKSVLASLRPNPQSRWARISVGIGRPASRDQSAVSNFVLSKIPRHARGILDEKASRGLYEALAQLEEKWQAEVPADGATGA